MNFDKIKYFDVQVTAEGILRHSPHLQAIEETGRTVIEAIMLQCAVDIAKTLSKEDMQRELDKAIDAINQHCTQKFRDEARISRIQNILLELLLNILASLRHVERVNKPNALIVRVTGDEINCEQLQETLEHYFSNYSQENQQHYEIIRHDTKSVDLWIFSGE